ncbi:MAG TPA: hypothetical protein VFD47_06390, partial [Actinomycetota bacterium]|nr:hypothetical protein [Actinomycetota bacterium]
FYDLVYLGLDFTWAKRLLIGGVWTRATLLLALMVVFMSARDALTSRRGEFPGPLRLESGTFDR